MATISGRMPHHLPLLVLGANINFVDRKEDGQSLGITFAIACHRELTNHTIFRSTYEDMTTGPGATWGEGEERGTCMKSSLSEWVGYAMGSRRGSDRIFGSLCLSSALLLSTLRVNPSSTLALL
jgi:hypothetical protein